ncbi:MAG TPA: zinc ribbon domain-containing protein [Armatimonadota bacterium]|jgi:putative FmdB family regulatory protein
MPLYEFQCAACQTIFEELVPMGSTGQGLNCPKCGAQQAQKKVSACNSRVSNAGPSCEFADRCADESGGAPGCCGGACSHMH